MEICCLVRSIFRYFLLYTVEKGSLEGVGEGHDSVADELQLVLEDGVLPRQALPSGAGLIVAAVVRRQGRVGVAAVEVVLPELCNNKIRE